MRAYSAFSIPFAAVFCTLLAACTNEAAIPAFVAIDYQVRCLGECRESVDDPGRRISNVDGEEDLEITCKTSTIGGKATLNFDIRCPGGKKSPCSETPFELSVEQLNFSDGDKVTDPGPGCKVFVREGSNRYEGECTAGDPAPEDDRPCSIGMERKGDFLEGSILCQDLPNEATKASTRYLVGPGSTRAAKFKLEGCEGL